MGFYLGMRVHMDTRDLNPSIYLKKLNVNWNYVLLPSINIVLLNNIQNQNLEFSEITKLQKIK